MIDFDSAQSHLLLNPRMPAEERRGRMGRMRQSVREQNIYRWAGLLLAELRHIPEEAADKGPASSLAPSDVLPRQAAAD